MSLTPQGLASFPGVLQLLDASVTLAHGISPSPARLSIVPQAGMPDEVGTLLFTFGGVAIAFPDCKVDSGSIERTAAGEVFRITLLDRRWRWRFGQISGNYNARRDDSSLQHGENGSIDTERTPQELATLCLEAMGETEFDVGDLPNDARPSVEWENALPAEALAALCDELGCRVVLQLDNKVAIRRLGEGAALPGGDALEMSQNINLPPRPDTIAVVGGPSRFQVDFRLEAVGLTGKDLQTSDVLAPIDELDYRPEGGWLRADLPYFHQVVVASRSLAQQSVFRYYRIRMPVVVPGYDGAGGNRIERLEQILPIEDEQVAVADENGQLSNLPAAVFGVWYPDIGDLANSIRSLAPLDETQDDEGVPGSRYRRPFKIDAARGLVIFDEPVYRNVHPSANGGAGYEVEIGPAELVLRAACSVRDPETLAIERFIRERASGANLGTEPRYLPHDEIVLTHIPSYDEDYALVDVQSNADAVEPISDHYLDAAEREYQITAPQTFRYAGLVPIEPDGAISQIHFAVGGAGATTSISRNSESPRLGPSHGQKRRRQRQRGRDAAAAKLSPRGLARSLKTNKHAKPRP